MTGEKKIDRLEKELKKSRRELASYQVAAARVGEHLAEIARLHRELSRTQKETELVLETTSDAMWLVDRDFNVVWANASLAKFCGKSSAELKGEKCHQAIRIRNCGTKKCILERVLREKKQIREETNVEIDGKKRSALVIGSPYYDERGEVVGILEDFIDITERKQAEETLKEHRDHLAELVSERTVELRKQVAESDQLNIVNRNLKETTRRLEEANMELKSFSYTASHDLRAPLRAIEGFARALREDHGDQLDREGNEYARRIVEASGRMETLINDLLAYSRISRAEIRLKPVSLERVIREVIADMEAPIRKKKAMITVAELLPRVRGHHSTLVQVAGNLISNALKFVAPGVEPRVKIWAEEKDNTAYLWVGDNGIGIAPEDRERIFQAFERLHGIETYSGTGIGLAIARRGAERMGGRIGLESEPGKGSKFWIELPIADCRRPCRRP